MEPGGSRCFSGVPPGVFRCQFVLVVDCGRFCSRAARPPDRLAAPLAGLAAKTAFVLAALPTFSPKATTWCAVMFMLCAFAWCLRTDKAVGGGQFESLNGFRGSAPKPAPATDLLPHCKYSFDDTRYDAINAHSNHANLFLSSSAQLGSFATLPAPPKNPTLNSVLGGLLGRPLLCFVPFHSPYLPLQTIAFTMEVHRGRAELAERT